MQGLLSTLSALLCRELCGVSPRPAPGRRIPALPSDPPGTRRPDFNPRLQPRCSAAAAWRCTPGLGMLTAWGMHVLQLMGSLKSSQDVLHGWACGLWLTTSVLVLQSPGLVHRSACGSDTDYRGCSYVSRSRSCSSWVGWAPPGCSGGQHLGGHTMAFLPVRASAPWGRVGGAAPSPRDP